MYRLIGQNLAGYAEYVADAVADLDNVPKKNMGSACLVIATGDLYILNGNKQWTKLSTE